MKDCCLTTHIHTHTYIYIYRGEGGTCCVMSTVVGNGHGDSSSIPGRAGLHFI